MHRAYSPTALATIVAMLVLAPKVSQAKDYCVTLTATPTYILVGQGFSIPAKGQCKPWTGFGLQLQENSPSVGTGCTSSDGTHLSLSIMTSFPENVGQFVSDSISLTLATQSGVDAQTLYNPPAAPQFIGALDATGATCKTKNAIP
jgi:hypothetical protein